MKRFLSYIPLIQMLLAPVAVIAAAAMDYEWALVSDRGVAAVFTLLFCVLVLRMPGEEIPALVAAMTPPFAMVNLYVWLYATKDGLVVLLFLVCAAVSMRLLKSTQLVKSARILSAVLALLAFVPYLLLLPFLAFGFAIGETEVVDTVYSPDGTYRAELLNVDQGALGGDTVVNVYNEEKVLDFGFAQLREKPNRVYMGPWGAFEDMELEWTSDSVLCIDGVAYEMED